MKTKAESSFLKPYCKIASSKTRIETIKNKGGIYIKRNEDDWNQELKPDMKYYQGWHLIVLLILVLANVYIEIKWLFFS
ncbi:hypothetical protein [Methanosarcina acetivorans]|uniref:hypothetical protein n=1 Tax=Methanosarcina acetivorans TaxID=2214 RepID=UPI0012FF410E|nr:hypothetical protein [Methanosarcina acetivorans]